MKPSIEIAGSPRADFWEGVLPIWVFGVTVAALGMASLSVPAELARRFSFASEHEGAVRLMLRAGGPALLAMGAAALITRWKWLKLHTSFETAVLIVLAVVGYVSLTTCLSDWMVDDAAITFAYSKNLAAGHGLVVHPGHAPEEGYSNTLWMLLLAAAGKMGADIAVTAKYASVACGGVAVALLLFACRRLLGPRIGFGVLALGMTVCLGAPFLIWSSSGLEHGLQAALLTLVATAPLFGRSERALMGAALSALVLTRPEAPVIVACVATALLGREGVPSRARAVLRRYWPVLAAPAAVWLALLVFRLDYFHDAMSNPYYAKAKDASWLRVANFVGPGWGYVGEWLADSRAWLLVPIMLMAPLRKAPLCYHLAMAVGLGQLGFVLFAGGDWMEAHRFIAPALPALAMVVVYAVAEAAAKPTRLSSTAACLVLVWFLGIGTVMQLAKFRANPTTPFSVVAHIGHTFVDLGRRLGVSRPSLAHHDAGGTSYSAQIELVDLGGLADRAVAQHMNDAEFMRRYLFEERRPTFIFGSSQTFAAGATSFHRMPQFNQYVRLKFTNDPLMAADLCHIRRDVVHEAPGIRHVQDGSGEYWTVD